MDVVTLLSSALAAVIAAVASFIGARWHYQKRVVEMQSRMDKLEVSRQTTQQHAQQMRKQVEALQKDIAALYSDKANADIVAARRRQAVEASLRPDTPAPQDGRASKPATPSHGFAATEVLDPTQPAPTGFATTQVLDHKAPALPANGFADTLPM